MTRTCGILLSAASETSHLPALTPEEELVGENIIYIIEKAIMGLLFLLNYVKNDWKCLNEKLNKVPSTYCTNSRRRKIFDKTYFTGNWTQDLLSQYTTYKAREVAILFLCQMRDTCSWIKISTGSSQRSINRLFRYPGVSQTTPPPQISPQNYWKNLTLKQEARYSSCTTCPMLVLDACGKCGSSLCTTNMTSTLRDKADPSSSASSTSLSTSSCIAGAEISRFKSKSTVWL